MTRSGYFAVLAALGLLLGGGVFFAQGAHASGETCAFTAPSFTVTNGLPFAYVKNETTVPSTTAAANLPTVNVPFTLQWTAAANGSPLQASDGYIAVLSSSDETDSANHISGQLVDLSGSYQAAFGGSGFGLTTKYATYTLTIQKNGVALANCKIRVQGDAITRTSADPHRPASYSQPLFPGGSYDLKVGSANTTVQYSYSLPVPLFGDHDTRFYGQIDRDFDPQLGQFHKGIYFFPHSSPGPTGMFDITDPMHPKPSNNVEWTHGDAYDMHGPISSWNWAHDAQYHGSAGEEDADGAARLLSYLGTNNGDKIITSFQNGAGTIGGMLDDTEDAKFKTLGSYGFRDPTRSWVSSHGGIVAAMAVPDSGKFYLYSAGTGSTPVSIYDFSDMPGVVHPSFYVNNVNQSEPNIKSSASIGWTNVSELQVIPSPDKSKYFLFGRVPGAIPNPSCADGSQPLTGGACASPSYIYHPEAAPTIKIGEINPNTGKLVKQKSTTISDVKQKESPPSVSSQAYYPPFSNIQWAIVNGTTYVFAIDDVSFDPSDVLPFPKALKIGIYKFDPVNLTLTRKSQVIIPNVTGDPLAAEAPVLNPTRYSVIGAEDGKSYPILVVPNDPPNSQASQAVRRYVNDAAELQFFGTKPFFAGASVTATAPDFILKSKGQHAKAGEEVIRGVPYLGFIRTESGKPNLYLFRNVFQATYDAQSSSIGFTGNPNADIIPYDVRYGGGLRVDKIDVTALSSGTSAPPAASGKLTFVKTLFDYDGCPQSSCGAEGEQQIGDILVWGKNGNKFAFAGEYGASYSGGHTGAVTQPLGTSATISGGGLWTANEDGSNIQERELSDTGYLGNATPHHGIRQNLGVLHYDWSSNAGFLADNGPSVGYMPWGNNAQQEADNLKTAKNTYRSVYYKEGTSGTAEPKSVSPIPEWRLGSAEVPDAVITMLNNKAVFGRELFSLPAWKDLGPVDATIGRGVTITLGDNVLVQSATVNGQTVTNEAKFYSVDSEGNATAVSGNIFDSGYWGIQTVLDQSTYPPKLAVLEYRMQQTQQYGTSLPHDAKIKVFKLASSGGVVLDRTLDVPEMHTSYPLRGFGVWGDYVVLPHKNASSTTIVGSETSPGGTYPVDSLELWKGGTKVDEAFLPIGFVGFGDKSIAISRSGYVAVAAQGGPRTTMAYLFKINGSSSTTTTPPAPGGGTPVGGGTPITTPPAPQTNNQCIQNFRNLCDQVQELQKSLCKLVPSLSFCSGGGSSTPTSPGRGGGGGGGLTPNQNAF